MTPFAHAFAYAIKKTPYAFFAKITLCMYILCDIVLRQQGNKPATDLLQLMRFLVVYHDSWLSLVYPFI